MVLESRKLPDSPRTALYLPKGHRAGPQGALGDPSEPLPGLSSLSSLQVGLLEVLVGKIFDLAFLPAMNGESYAQASAGLCGLGPGSCWFVGHNI